MLVLVLVTLWLPATLHCKLEELPGLQFLACCDHENTAPHQDDDCRNDSCAMVEDGLYKTSNPKVEVPLPLAVVVLDLTVAGEATPLTLPNPSQFLDDRVPELPVTWQFSSRAALLPRAPSFVS